MKEKRLITILVILAVIIIAIIILTRSNPAPPEEELAKCIGSRAVLYMQLGCHACETQEKMFGDSYQYLSIVDCFFEQDKCIKEKIEATPTWIINGEQYKGARPVAELKELTGC